MAIQNIVSTLFLAETHFDREALIQRLLLLFDSAEDRYAISLFINWCRQLKLRDRMANDDFVALETVYRSQEEVGKMLNVAMQREQERWVQEHMVELLPKVKAEQGEGQGQGQGRGQGRGKAEVKAEVEAEAKAEVIMQLLTYRFGALEGRLV